jgi:hypothetical protein
VNDCDLKFALIDESLLSPLVWLFCYFSGEWGRRNSIWKEEKEEDVKRWEKKMWKSKMWKYNVKRGCESETKWWHERWREKERCVKEDVKTKMWEQYVKTLKWGCEKKIWKWNEMVMLDVIKEKRRYHKILNNVKNMVVKKNQIYQSFH